MAVSFIFEGNRTTGENYQSAATVSHKVVSNIPWHEWDSTSQR